VKTKLTLLFLLFILSCELFPQAVADTLRYQLNQCSSDSCKIRVKNLILEELLYSDEGEAKALAEELFMSVPPTDSLNYLSTQCNYASMCLIKGNSNKAFNILSDLKLTGLKANNKLYLAKANFGLARFYMDNNDLKTAIDLSFLALRLFEGMKDQKSIANCYSQIASINYKLKNFEKAIDFYKKCLDVANKINYHHAVAQAYNGMGNLYSKKDMSDIALEYYTRALAIQRQQKHELQVASILINIGSIFSDKEQYQQAEKYMKEALALNLKYNLRKNIAACYVNLGNICYNLNNFKDAEINYSEALKYLEPQDLLIKESLFYNLGEVNFKLGNLEKALKYNDSCMTVKDSLYSRESIRSLNDMQTKYETEKTKLELDKKELEANNKQVVIYAAFSGCILLLGLAFFIFRGLRGEKKNSQALEEKNKIINDQKHLVEEKNKDIGDSIRYAQRIQQAILPPDALWQSALKHSFVLYAPKDILSGDFYWLEETNDFVFLAAADCTGHGVPGALVSIVNYNMLNKAVLEKNITLPGEILDAANQSLTQSLHQSYNEAQIKDGMDVALLSISKKTGEIHYAGANNPVYILSDGKITVIKANKFPVGAFIEENIQNFTTHKLNVKKGDRIYLFSDGFADQFGGPKGKKYKYKQLQEKLIASSHLNFPDQKNFMLNDFLTWKGNLEQVDDVLLMGFEV
jgi:serine phosphatase RsbU (regulator of sigma subunit)